MIEKIDEETRQRQAIIGAIASLDYEKICETLLQITTLRSCNTSSTRRVLTPYNDMIYTEPLEKTHKDDRLTFAEGLYEGHNTINQQIIKKCGLETLLKKIKALYNLEEQVFLFLIGFVNININVEKDSYYINYCSKAIDLDTIKKMLDEWHTDFEDGEKSEYNIYPTDIYEVTDNEEQTQIEEAAKLLQPVREGIVNAYNDIINRRKPGRKPNDDEHPGH